MTGTLVQWLGDISSERLKYWLYKVLAPIVDRYSTQTIVSGALAIHGLGSTLAKTGADWYGFVKGNVVKVAAADMPALAGTVTHANFCVWAFFVDAAGTVTASFGTQGATLAAVVFPPIPAGKACIGFVIINPTGTGNFVGGTTALDDATVVPNAVYVNTLGPFDPTVLVG